MKKLIFFGVLVVLMSLVEIFGPKSIEQRAESISPIDIDMRQWRHSIWIPSTEPNEPLNWIPTWPEYYELQKDLVIELSFKDIFEGIEISEEFTFPKGTRIYFKDE